MLKNDSLENVLYINLTRRTFRVERRRELFEQHIGGTGVATQLLHEECREGCDPLGPDNPIIFAVGPLTALFPLASKAVAMFKSPLNGNLGESHCGGRSAIAIRMAGYGAIVIQGASTMPVYLTINGNQIHFRDASSLWGMGNFSTGRIIRENETGSGLRTIMRIGKAGEKLITYSCVMSETFRHFGRLGLGAVFGSKKLKAVVVSGRSSLPISDRKIYRKLYDEVYTTAVDSTVMKKYHDLGTAENIVPLNRFGGLPTRNLTGAQFENAPRISGETFARQYLGRRLACSHCPVGCIHIAALREPYEDVAYFYKTSMISYDYEPIYALGTMLGISKPVDFLKLMDRVEEAWGMDAMSLGVILAWATEAFQRGLITEDETRGVKLKWGDAKAYVKAGGYIIDQPNDFYQTLARGVEYASSIYGGKEFALSFGGNEMPGYHTGPGAHLGVLIGTRHSHLDNAGYSIDQKNLVEKKMKPEELVDVLLNEERWRQILSSLVVCFFARGIYSPELVTRLLDVAGFDLSPDDLQRVGREIHTEKYRFKMREGFSLDTVRIPERIFETPTPIPWLNKQYLKEALTYAQKTIVHELEEKK
ncbi:MAG TPA: aldehyde ferredoxin oxidoreductase family protein [Syntrophales bacterium]|nr:aldehyde ferredoxin oxidoreductase family protein [Syntrophales bacterium]HPQ44399.1 aldehyde ferredoxin oxidoreductase family protein [Syntrophales bacterium]